MSIFLTSAIQKKEGVKLAIKTQTKDILQTQSQQYWIPELKEDSNQDHFKKEDLPLQIQASVVKLPQQKKEEDVLQERNSEDAFFDLVAMEKPAINNPKTESVEDEVGVEHKKLAQLQRGPESSPSSQFLEVFCDPFSTTGLLDGFVLIECGRYGVRLKVRLCTMEDFDLISSRLSSEGAVSRKTFQMIFLAEGAFLNAPLLNIRSA